LSSLKEDYGKGRGWRGTRNLLISILLYFRSLFYLNEDDEEETREWGQTRFNLDVDIEKGEKRERKKKI